jgi:HTH-type transcriptional regulator/antitoxin HigA
MLTKRIEEANRDYRRVRRVVPLGVLRTQAEYTRAVKTLDEILDEIGEDEAHPLAELADALGLFIENYEATHVRPPRVKPAKILKHLMHEHRLRQSDLSEIGSQGVVSEILTGKRALNTRQIRALAKRFSVSPTVFI